MIASFVLASLALHSFKDHHDNSQLFKGSEDNFYKNNFVIYLLKLSLHPDNST